MYNKLEKSVFEWTAWPFHVSMAAANEASWGCYDIKTVCDRCSWVVLSLPLCLSHKGVFHNPRLWRVKRYPPSSHPNRPSLHPSLLPSAAPIVMVTACDTAHRKEWFLGFSDFLSSPWITTQRLRWGERSWLAASEIWLLFCLLWYMEAARLATLHCSGCTLFLSTEIIVLV